MTNWLPRKSVVVPIDFSDDSFAAVELALAMVEQGSNLHVIHVMPHLSPEEPGIIWDSIDITRAGFSTPSRRCVST